jgi:alginate O-acetyltransferase complex protein AlgJ
MKARSLSAMLVSFTFVMLCCMPLFMSLLTSDEEMSSAEKRRFAALPELTISSKSLREFPAAFEKYYNDHFGFRDKIVRFHNRTICSIFKVSPSSAVTVGSDNWYFFNAGGGLPDYFGATQFSDRTLARFAQALKDRETWLASLGIHYLFLPVPNKSSVYSEYLPRRVARSGGRTKYEQITSYLREESDFVNWLDTYDILAGKKVETHVYLRTDSHWNHDGVYWVYRELIHRLTEWLPDISPMELKEDKEWVENFSGDLATLMNLRGVITETAPLVNVRSRCEPRKLKRMEWILQLDQYRDVDRRRLPEENGCDDRQYTALFIHDSFGKFLRPLLSQHFKKVIYVNYFNFESIRPVIEQERVDVVMDLRVSRNLQKALNFDEPLEQLVLGEKFDRLSDTLMHLGIGSWHTFIEGENEMLTSASAEVLTLEINEPRPFLSLVFDEGEGDGPLVVEVDITSQHNTTLSVLYLTDRGPDFSEGLFEKRKITSGRQKVYFRILDPDIMGKIRLQPGASGSYLLHSITVKRENV